MDGLYIYLRWFCPEEAEAAAAKKNAIKFCVCCACVPMCFRFYNVSMFDRVLNFFSFFLSSFILSIDCVWQCNTRWYENNVINSISIGWELVVLSFILSFFCELRATIPWYPWTHQVVNQPMDFRLSPNISILPILKSLDSLISRLNYWPN